MSKINNSSFQFVNFLVKESHLILNHRGKHEFEMSFNPSGVVFPSLGQFHLHLDFEVKDDSEDISITVKTLAIFSYSNIEDIRSSDFFLFNAPAIVFPYLRAYISNLTTQSGIAPIILPTLNLTGMAEILKDNILIDDDNDLTYRES